MMKSEKHPLPTAQQQREFGLVAGDTLSDLVGGAERLRLPLLAQLLAMARLEADAIAISPPAPIREKLTSL